MSEFRSIAALLRKDLLIELRALRGFAGVALLGVLLVGVLAIGLAPGGSAPVTGAGASAVLWAAYLFGGVLCVERSMDAERRDDAFGALLMAPVSRGGVFVSKLAVNLVLLGGLACVVTPVAGVLLRVDVGADALGFMRTTLLGLVGFASVATLFGALTPPSGRQGGLLGLLVFPLCLPLVLASSHAMAESVAGQTTRVGAGGAISAEGLMVAFDVVFLVAGWLMFEVAVEA